MSDPYQILGISRDASEEDIKKAYRNLSRRYHPDANINNPNKDKAEEKFKQVQSAYQQIMKEKEQGTGAYEYGSSGHGYEDFGGFGGFGFGGGFYGAHSRQQAESDQDDLYMRAAANYINSRHYREAINVLDGIADKDARWYYYSAIANAGIGNNVQALEYAQKACSLDPGNSQYQNLVDQLEYGGNWYQSRQSPYGQPVNLGNNFCFKLCIANMICNLCCGGGGMCCGGGGIGYPY